MDVAEHQHFAWLARSFGRTDYLPLTVEDLDALGAAGEYVDKYPGTHLFREGEESIAAYVVKAGNVELYRSRPEGDLVVGRVGPGAAIGDIALFQGAPYISSAKAVEPVIMSARVRIKVATSAIAKPTTVARTSCCVEV